MLSVIIPVYNEGINIEELVKRIEKTLINIEYEIIFVDDSTDTTTEIIKCISTKDEKVKFEHRENKDGLSSAVVKGFEIAKGDIMAVMDGDLQHPPEILSDMIDTIYKGADIVVPSRFIPGGNDGGLNLFRKLVSAGARYMAKILLKKTRIFSDPTSGIFMFKNEVIEGKELCTVGWKILMEILVIGEYENSAEIPYKFCSRNFGKSKMSLKVQIDYIIHLLSLIKRSKEDKRFYSFCSIGLLGVFVDMSIFALMSFMFPTMHVKTAGIISTSVAIISNYILNNSITWGDKIENKPKMKNELFNVKFIKYVMVSFTGIFIKFIILLIFYSMLKFNKYIGNLIGILCSSFSNYYMSKYYVFEVNKHNKI
jgi:dolichol-phosphate mannosyltransferase